MLLSYQDYANNRGVSYESVRKQVSRYKKDLDGHIKKEGRISFLDDWAISFLDEHRNKNTVVVQRGESKEVQELKDEVNQLMKKYIDLLESTRDLPKLEDLQKVEQERDQVKEELNQVKEERDEVRVQLEQVNVDLDHTKSDLNDAQNEVDRLKNRSLWDRIINK